MKGEIKLEFMYGILGLAVLIGIAILWGKLKDATRKAVNQKVFYRSEHKEAQMLVTEPVIFETSAKMDEIIKALRAQIMPAEVIPAAVKTVIYISSLNESRITFAKGNKFAPKAFEAEVNFNNSGSLNVYTFKILTWTEIDGIIKFQDDMRRLRKQVVAAFSMVDPVGKITGV